MKQINVTVEDKEYERIVNTKRKLGSKNWREYLIKTSELLDK